MVRISWDGNREVPRRRAKATRRNTPRMLVREARILMERPPSTDFEAINRDPDDEDTNLGSRLGFDLQAGEFAR